MKINNILKKDLHSFTMLWNQEKDILTSSNLTMTDPKAESGFKKRMFDCYGLFENKKLIGFILIKENSEGIWVKHMVIDKNYRAKGLGSFFLSNVLERYFERKRIYKVEVLINNVDAIVFFEKNGFKVEKTLEEGQYILSK
jgi:ribosomal protein S18 acetylase RimI-like enzyme